MSGAEEHPPPKANLRKGWTTGTCAAAAARAAYEALLCGRFPLSVSITLPGGARPSFALALEELGEGFAITGIKRHRSELFERLSDGTQEQIAVLVRLGMGAMLAERGRVVHIILDDALVYCDDDRIQRMFDALSRAGKHQQIIVLTCRLRTFGPLGGHTLRLRPRPEQTQPSMRECAA